MKPQIGLITAIIAQELERDLWGTLEAVARAGYRGLELGSALVARSGLTAPAFRERLNALGLQAVTCGTDPDGLAAGLDRTIADALALGCEHVTLWWAPCESRAGLLEAAALYNRAGERCRAAGLKFCYHNHDHEFRRFDGEYGLDILFANTDPALVHANLDTAWVRYGGEDPAAYIRKYAGRCPVVHAKDIADLSERAAFTEVGTGVVDFQAVVAAAKEAGVRWLVVEQDSPRDLPGMESIRVSYRNLARMVSEV